MPCIPSQNHRSLEALTWGVQQKADAQRRSGSYPVVAETVILLESIYLSLAQINFDTVERGFRSGCKRGVDKDHA
jgi:hypothetical protein